MATIDTRRQRFSTFSIAILLFLTAGEARASVKNWQKDPDGVSFALDIGGVKGRVCTDEIIEVKYTMLPKLQTKPSLVVNNLFSTTPAFTATETGNTVVIQTKRLRVVVDKATNAVTYTDLTGAVI